MHILRRIPSWIVIALLMYMPLHVFLAQWLSLATGGLDVWKLAKDLLLLASGLFTICLVWRERRATREYTWLLGLFGAYSALHAMLWALHPTIFDRSALLGFIYNDRVLGYLIMGMGAGLLLSRASKESLTLLTKIVLGVSTLVSLLGILQFFLPKDIMTHFGYGLDRGTLPAFFIDNKPEFPRIMATLRDPNSLGAYLIVPITFITSLLFTGKPLRQRLLLGGVLGVHALALILTFSRGAWAAALLTLGLLCTWRFREQVVRTAKRYWPILAVAGVLAISGLAVVRNTYVFKSYITHSTGKPQAEYDSNGFHWVFVQRGLEGIAHNPWGHGPGTAGLASIQNPAGSFLTENYYVQIGYELGVVGLLLFLAANVLVVMTLWRRRDEIWPLVLLASFWGYVLLNMLFHMWSNEAVAAQWWLLAGFVIALPLARGTRITKVSGPTTGGSARIHPEQSDPS